MLTAQRRELLLETLRRDGRIVAADAAVGQQGVAPFIYYQF